MKMMILPAIALLALVGCADNEIDETAMNEPLTTEEPAAAGQPMNTDEEPAPAGAMNAEPASPMAEGQATGEDDQQLAQRVEKVLKEDLATSDMTKNIEITATNGEVTLAGSVESEQQKVSIEKKVQQIVGVTRVNNQLAVG